MGADADLPCFICKVRRPTFLPDLPDPPRFIRYDGDPSARVKIQRAAAAYPGEQTGDIVKAGAVLPFTSKSSLEHTHIDGVRYTIIFYQLTDGLGWIQKARHARAHAWMVQQPQLIGTLYFHHNSHMRPLTPVLRTHAEGYTPRPPCLHSTTY